MSGGERERERERKGKVTEKEKRDEWSNKLNTRKAKGKNKIC